MAEELKNNEWLCLNANSTKPTENQQTEVCSMKSCKTYGDWSSWSTCSRICGGSSIRKRDCIDQTKCNMDFLNQTRTCGLIDCPSISISKF